MRKILVAAFALLTSASATEDGALSSGSVSAFNSSQRLSDQIHVEVNRVLEQFRVNMDAYYQRTRVKKGAAIIVSSTTEDAHGTEQEKQKDYNPLPGMRLLPLNCVTTGAREKLTPKEAHEAWKKGGIKQEYWQPIPLFIRITDIGEGPASLILETSHPKSIITEDHEYFCPLDLYRDKDYVIETYDFGDRGNISGIPQEKGVTPGETTWDFKSHLYVYSDSDTSEERAFISLEIPDNTHPLMYRFSRGYECFHWKDGGSRSDRVITKHINLVF